MSDNEHDEHLRTARTLSEALPYMRRFAGQVFVVKYGGHAMGDDQLARTFARDVVLMKQVGINPVVVHGGGPQIGAMLDRLKIKSSFVDGLRVTDAETVDIVEMVLSGSINKQVVTAINNAGGSAIGLSGKDGRLIEARKLQRLTRDPDSNIEKVLDLGFVGEPVRIDPGMLDILDRSDLIPVVAPIGVGAEGETYNINADTVAGKIAATLRAAKLIMLTDVAGVLNGEGGLISKMSPAQARELMAGEVIKGGMIPKLETCLSAVEQGVAAAHILDGRLPHVLLLEAFTEAGVGTMIEADG
ncbi:MAG: acetylglutamate kinase [Alphaproteobacteria bacterium]|jgi:acetylglutamate kinase|nr:acetylglutamate kinase [Alphaproteobacteria bacterium]MDP6567680.1 acetylglutamate kinase [Alphaproteobacteria bacterium]MDP6814542.1 acetylglutamate kinase [Alphaproteobacteria bacterium]